MSSEFDKNQGSHYSSELVLKESADYYGKSLRTIDSRSVVNQFYTHFRATYSGEKPTLVDYFRGTLPHKTEIYTSSAASLNNKHLSLFSGQDERKYTLWFNVDGLGVAPVVADTFEYIEIPLLSSDNSSIVASAIQIKINTSYSDIFKVERVDQYNHIEILAEKLGETQDSLVGTSGFVIQNTAGTQELVQSIVIEYNEANPIYNGQELPGYSYDIYSGKFIKNLSDLGSGSTTDQTLRVTANVMGTDPNGATIENKESGRVDSNSTSTPLLANATYTGAWVDASQYSCISWTVNSDVDSAVNGLRLQFSMDGSTIIRQSATNFTGSANGVFFSFPVHAKYFRMFYQNGPVNQTRFQLDTQLHEEYNGLAAVPLDTPLTDKSSATTVKSVISGKSVDGTYVNQRADGVSSSNSTTTTLLAGQTFTGPFEEILGYANISIVAYSDVASATDGLKLEYSTNGVDVDDFDSFTVSAANGTQVSSGATTKYFRIRYTNGSSNQSVFRLQTVYHITAPKSSTHRIDDSINGQNDAELNKAVITGKNPDGEFINVSASGVVSSNSTTTPLGIGGVFQGSYFDNAGFIASSFFCLTDRTGTLVIETSDDASTVIRTSTFNIIANQPFYVSQTSVGRYTRVRVTNTSGVAQTFLRLQTLLKMTPISPTALTIASPLESNSVALNSRSILAGQQENGTFRNVDLSNTGSVKVAITDRPSEVRNRTKIEARIFNTSLTSVATLVHTVTPGKTLYVESMIISALNNTNAIGEWRITDGATDKLGYLLGEKTAGVPATSSSSSPALPEPIPFTTNFGAREISGDIILSIYIIGYEE